MMNDIIPCDGGNVFSGRQFGLRPEHKFKGNCYLLVEK